MASLPSIALIGEMVRIEGEEAEIEIREIKVPLPLVTRQGKKFPIGTRGNVVDIVSRWFGAARGKLPIMVSEDGKERGRAKESRIVIDESGKSEDALVSAPVEAGNIVSRGEEEMNIVFDDRRKISVHGPSPVPDHGDAELLERIAFEGKCFGHFLSGAHPVVVGATPFRDGDFDVMESDVFLDRNSFPESLGLTELDDGSAGFLRHPIDDEMGGTLARVT